jgi:hypothetical protein
MRIVLHPQLLQERAAPYQTRAAYLTPGWTWWRHKLRPCPDGAMYHQAFDDPQDVRQISIQFDLLYEYDIVDPPAFCLTQRSPEYDTVHYGERDRIFMTRGIRADCDVVWHERPGPLWHALPGNTCEPGNCIIEMVGSDGQRDGMSTEIHAGSNLPRLIWPIGGSSTRELSLSIETGGQRTFEDHFRLIHNARDQFTVLCNRPPSAVLMNHRDYHEMIRDLLLDERAGHLIPRNAPGVNEGFAVFGIDIQIDSSLDRGRIVLVGDESSFASGSWFDNFDRSSVDDLMRRPQFPRELQFPRVPLSRWSEQLSINSRRLAEGLHRHPDAVPNLPVRSHPPPSWPRRGPNVLPEAECIDEIDKLVNEQIKPGPSDDYSIDRYPKCPHCPHSWHGILCNACACLGELEEEA